MSQPPTDALPCSNTETSEDGTFEILLVETNPEVWKQHSGYLSGLRASDSDKLHMLRTAAYANAGICGREFDNLAEQGTSPPGQDPAPNGSTFVDIRRFLDHLFPDPPDDTYLVVSWLTEEGKLPSQWDQSS